jgi:hypothetical protein
MDNHLTRSCELTLRKSLVERQSRFIEASLHENRCQEAEVLKAPADGEASGRDDRDDPKTVSTALAVMPFNADAENQVRSPCTQIVRGRYGDIVFLCSHLHPIRAYMCANIY